MGIVKGKLKDGSVRYYPRLKVGARTYWGGGYSTKSLAEMALTKMRREAERQRAGLPRSSDITLAKFADQYLDWAKRNKRSWKRDEGTLPILTKSLGTLRLTEVTPARVEEHRKKRLQVVEPATVNRDVALLKKMLSLAVQWELIEVSPLRRLQMLKEPPPRSPVLSSTDEEKLLRGCSGYLHELIVLALATGARQGELLALTAGEIDFEQGVLVIRDSKSGDPRLVPLATASLERLKPFKDKPANTPVISLRSKPVASGTASQAFRRLAARQKLNLTFHDLRHVAATRMLSKGAGLLHIATLLGHRTLAMSRRYSHVQMEDLRKVVETINTTPQTPSEKEKPAKDSKGTIPGARRRGAS